MNDRLIIHDRRYLINDISTTLNNGEVKMNLLRELITFDFECECVRVSFTYEGVEYSFDVPKVGDNHFYLVTDLIIIDIATANDDWFIDLDGENLFYGNYYQTFNDGCPFFNDWIYNFGDTFENLTTTPCE